MQCLCGVVSHGSATDCLSLHAQAVESGEAITVGQAWQEVHVGAGQPDVDIDSLNAMLKCAPAHWRHLAPQPWTAALLHAPLQLRIGSSISMHWSILGRMAGGCMPRVWGINAMLTSQCPQVLLQGCGRPLTRRGRGAVRARRREGHHAERGHLPRACGHPDAP